MDEHEPAGDLEDRIRLIPIAAAAKSLGLARKTLDREARDGRLVLTRVRWKVFIRSEDLEAWLDRCRSPRRVLSLRPIGRR
jgi:excisionase family DNA binding protein